MIATEAGIEVIKLVPGCAQADDAVGLASQSVAGKRERVKQQPCVMQRVYFERLIEHPQSRVLIHNGIEDAAVPFFFQDVVAHLGGLPDVVIPHRSSLLWIRLLRPCEERKEETDDEQNSKTVCTQVFNRVRAPLQRLPKN